MSSGAANNGNRWTPEAMIQFKRVADTAISPDGRLIAYTVSIPMMEGEKSEYLTHVWVASADGKQNEQFTRGEKSCTKPQFSPDGKLLAFLSDREQVKKNQIYVLRFDGGEAQKLTTAKSSVNDYAWSPDGKHIAFTMNDPESDDEAASYKQKRDMKLIDQSFKMAHLYLIAVDENSDSNVPAERRLSNGSFHATNFDWSPDGKTIAFSHQVNPTVNEWPTTDISTVTITDGAVKLLVNWKGSDSQPHYSPDGRWLTFVSDSGQARWAQATDIFVMPSAGGLTQKLAATSDRRPQIVGWSANSKDIYYTETEHSNRRFFALSVEGKSPRVMSPGAGNFYAPAWSRDGRTVAMIHEAPEFPPDVYVSSASSFSPKKLTDVNADFPNFRMGRTEVISWRSKDGREIEGLLTYPINHEIDKACPLILNIHGGPAGVFTQNFTAASSVYPLQAFAQQGYAVLRPNPRGSSGYGKDFRFANYKDWGFGDYEDLIAGVNKIVGMGVAHPDSLCVMGWSYGGYMTSFIITKSNQFKVASVGAGVTNLMSFTGTADIPGFLPDYFGAEPWDDLETYMRHSAMFNIKGVNIPTQIIHGEEDLRVPLSQGQELYNALKRQNCPTEMIVYPRTPHGVREPKFIQDVGERIIAWFNLHLRKRGVAQPVVAK
jgi:dipeptidyl aminopeptidase/acylaminoacyl peptidase